MKFRRLGRTGLKVSELCLGTMQWGWTTDEVNSFAVMDAFMEAGGNFIDTADIYTSWAEGNPGGVSEEIIGRWMKARGNRDDVVLATKVRGRMWDGPNGEGLSRAHIMRACEDSLRRLQVETIDLYQTHWRDKETPIEETLEALDILVRQGKVRYIGCSNYPAAWLMESLWVSDRLRLARFDSVQPHYNLVHRHEFEREVQAVCVQYGIGVIPWSPLAGGFLTGKYSRENAPQSERLSETRQRYFNDWGWNALDVVRAVAQETNSTPTAVSLAWLLAQPAMTSPIFGANTVAQMQDSLAAVDVTLSPEQVQRLTDATVWVRDEHSG